MYELQRMTDYRVMKKQMMNFTIFKTFEIATMTIEYSFTSNLKFVLKVQSHEINPCRLQNLQGIVQN